MALDKSLRDGLRARVQVIRQALTEDLARSLEATFGVHRDGRLDPVTQADLPAVVGDVRARETRELLERVLVTARGDGRRRFEEAFDELVRQLAFTHLNRLVAFKVLERRRVIRESVGRGVESRGFKHYLAGVEERDVVPSGEQEAAYSRYLGWLCKSLDQEIGILFDPEDLASRVNPSYRTLQVVLGAINDAEIDAAWDHEETLGWTYQFYTPREVRKEARSDNTPPRNSYEMAVRNQFYTPDYVVRFLADNTLGRLWLEMKPDSEISKRATFLVPPSGDRLRRPKKDPRLLRIIDPACGSGHFLLYCFELFEVIYAEAWDDADLGLGLRQAFPKREDLLVAAPQLIVENNLFGIDIDRRAAQIAALTLYVKAKSRNPDVRIERSHVVASEPMPGDRALLDDFKHRKLGGADGVVSRILDAVWRHMEMAGEAGSLLLAEREIVRLVEDERSAWAKRRSEKVQEQLFGGKPRDDVAYADADGANFWNRVESDVERLLREYAGEAAGAEAAHRRMFARDGVAGMRLIDVLRNTYDVVLMNPPFGKPSVPSRAYVDATFPRTKNDVYAAFVERWLERLEPRGRLGAITSRTGFFLKSFAKWREEVLLKKAHVELVADLGSGVLDTAMVEVAAYVLERAPEPASTPLAL